MANPQTIDFTVVCGFFMLFYIQIALVIFVSGIIFCRASISEIGFAVQITLNVYKFRLIAALRNVSI